jgi:acyl carrier protein
LNNTDEILRELNTIFILVFKDKDLNISYNTTAEDIQGWDSFSNIELILDIEKRFNIHFDLKELRNMDNIGKLSEYILDKTRLI